MPSPPPPTSVVTPHEEATPQSEAPAEDDMHHSEHEAELINSPPSSYVPLNIHRSYTSTPSLCSASDTDTESETPSVSSPCPSSPAESDLAHYFESRSPGHPHAEIFDSELHQHPIPASHNPYFPAISHGGSVLSHVAGEAPIVRKLKLEALPSPVLQPPSPFCLDGPGQEELEEESVKSGVTTVARGSPVRSGTLTKRPFIPRPSSLSCLSSLAQGQQALDAVSESLSALTTSGTPVFPPTSETPELTVETMRAPAYVRIPEDWRRGPSSIESGGDGVLEPSIRRRVL